MGTVADSNYGFFGEVTSAQTPVILGRGVRYSVEGPTDLAVSIGGSGDRAVSVAAGSAWGDGVLSQWDAGATLNGAAVSSGSRWDTVVIRREWTPQSSPTGTATLMLLSGGSSQAISVNRTTDAGVTTSDQPLALVRFAAGQTAAQQVVDLRAWAGAGGGYVAQSTDVRSYLDSVGTQLLIGSTLHFRRLSTLGTPEWYTNDLDGSTINPDRLGAPTQVTGGYGSSASGFATAGLGSSMYTWGRMRQLLLMTRRSGSTLTFNSDGWITNTPIFTLDPAHQPRSYTMCTAFMRNGTGTAAVAAELAIGGDGVITLVSSKPGAVLATRSAADGESLRITATYLAKS